MPEHDGALVHALRPGGPDVVQPEHVEQARAGHPGDDRERDRAEGDGRQDHVADRVDEELPVERDDRVEDVHVREEVQDRRAVGPVRSSRPHASRAG